MLDRIAAVSGSDYLRESFPDRIGAITRRDIDSLLFVDYLSINVMAVEDKLTSLFEDIRSQIEQALVSARSNIRVFQKVACKLLQRVAYSAN